MVRHEPEICEILRDLRKDLGLTQAEVGARLNPPVLHQQISFWETGRFTPQLDNLQEWCHALGARLVVEIPSKAGTP